MREFFKFYFEIILYLQKIIRNDTEFTYPLHAVFVSVSHLLVHKLAPSTEAEETEERGTALQTGWRIRWGRELIHKVCLGCHKMSAAPRLPARIWKFIEKLSLGSGRCTTQKSQHHSTNSGLQPWAASRSRKTRGCHAKGRDGVRGLWLPRSSWQANQWSRPLNDLLPQCLT